MEHKAGIAKLWQEVQDFWDSLSQDAIRHLYDHLEVRLHAWVAARWGYTIHWIVWPPYCELYTI
jgi:hypothetical protein